MATQYLLVNSGFGTFSGGAENKHCLDNATPACVAQSSLSIQETDMAGKLRNWLERQVTLELVGERLEPWHHTPLQLRPDYLAPHPPTQFRLTLCFDG